jgi:RimJ/RimL family protein N-acetyltransferase
VLRPEFPIKTRRLVLRPYLESDLDALADIQGRPEVVRYLCWEPRDLEQVRVSLREWLAQATIEKPGDRLHVAVTLAETGVLIGDVMLVWHSA